MACLRTFSHTIWFAVRPAFLVILTGSLALIGGTSLTRAQSSDSVMIEAMVEPSPVGVDEIVTLTIRVEGASLADIETPDSPLTKGLALQQPTPATRRNVSFSNGRLTRSVTFQWTYRPIQTGMARIHPVKVTVQGSTHETEAIDVRVDSQSQRAQQPPGPSRGLSGQRPNSRSRPQRPSLIEAQDLFIRAEPEARQVYQNEQVTVTYHLYFREGIQLRHSRLANAWDATGFWREELKVESRPIPRSVTVNGRTYQTIVLKRAALFPTRAGSLWVDPLEIETEARVTDRLQGRVNPFYSPQQAYESVALASDSLMIRSEPLPDGAPPIFKGAVGDFELHTNVNSSSVQVGQSVRLRVRIEGIGNIATLQPPAIDPPAEFEVYDPKEHTSIQRDGRHVRGTKTFTYVLVPHSGGTYTFSPTAFAYFDPEQRRYRTLRAPIIELQVSGDEAPAAVSTTGSGLPVDDVASIMTESQTWIRTERRPLYLSPWPYMAMLVPLLIAGGIVAARRRSSRSEANATASPSVHEEAHLQRARRYMHNRQPEACYDEIERTVLSFIGSRLGVAATGLTREQLDTLLARYEVPVRAREALDELLDVCDQARYSPAQPSEKAMQSAIHRAQQLIDFLGPKLA